MPRSEKLSEAPGHRMKRLAQKLDSLAEKDDGYRRMAEAMDAVRTAAACELHAICRDYVQQINALLAKTEVLFDPEEFSAHTFQRESVNVFQISVRGRILQVVFSTTPELVCTEDFRVPYTLCGAVRAFNRELLEKEIIEEQLVFYTVEKTRKLWRFFDPRTYRSGTFDQEYLTSLMEQLV